MNEKTDKKEVRKCPWCGKETLPKMRLLKKSHGDVRERRCSRCGKLLAAYLVEEGDFMSGIRAFPNS